MRRLADYYLNKAPTLEEMKKAHRKFIRDYNCQIHFAHRERNDNRHSPQDVLRGVLARTLPAPTLARIFFATEFTRHLDRSGYIRFRRWRFYAESGLAKRRVQGCRWESAGGKLILIRGGPFYRPSLLANSVVGLTGVRRVPHILRQRCDFSRDQIR
jgi:hypothetical protein